MSMFQRAKGMKGFGGGTGISSTFRSSSVVLTSPGIHSSSFLATGHYSSFQLIKQLKSKIEAFPDIRQDYESEISSHRESSLFYTQMAASDRYSASTTIEVNEQDEELAAEMKEFRETIKHKIRNEGPKAIKDYIENKEKSDPKRAEKEESRSQRSPLETIESATRTNPDIKAYMNNFTEFLAKQSPEVLMGYLADVDIRVEKRTREKPVEVPDSKVD